MKRQPSTVRTADEIVAALSLPISVALPPQLGRPLPITTRNRLPSDASMVYAIARVDASGRVASADILEALRWRPGDKLLLTVTHDAIVVRTSLNGSLPVPQRPYITLPAKIRRLHAVRTGDQVMLAAAPDYGVVIIYPISVLDEMIKRYQSAHINEGKHACE